MQVPVVATFKHSHGADVSEPIKCAPVFKPTSSERHKHELVRYVVLAIAFLAVVLLIAIALYYTDGNAVHLKHISSLQVFVPAHTGTTAA